MKTKTTLMFAILMVLVLIGVNVYGFERIKSENESASALTNQSVEVNNANSVALATKNDKADAAGNLEILDQIELSQSRFVPFLELLEKTGRDLGVKAKIASVNADPVAKGAATTSAKVYVPPQNIHIVINGSGTWAATLGFVHSLENLPHKVSLDNVTLNYNPPADVQGNASSTGVGVWQVGVTLTTAIYPN